MLEGMLPQMSGWSEGHACRFDLGKFQLIHFTRNERKYTPLPLTISGHVVPASDSAKYLGIVLDRRLRWREHADMAIAKGTSVVLAIGRLARPTFGLPHSHIRQLFQAVVVPKMEYGLPVWYTPVRQVEGSSRLKGSVGLARRLGKVQRVAALLITGAFKSTSSIALDYHAGLLPIDLRLNVAAFNAAARLASLPPSHPLHKPVTNCTHRYPHLHRSSLHELFNSFPELCNIETVDPGLWDPTFQAEFETLEGEDKGSAAAMVDDIVSSGEFCVFTDGSGYQDGIGAAAVATGRNERKHVRRAYLGSDQDHLVYGWHDPRARHHRL